MTGAPPHHHHHHRRLDGGDDDDDDVCLPSLVLAPVPRSARTSFNPRQICADSVDATPMTTWPVIAYFAA